MSAPVRLEHLRSRVLIAERVAKGCVERVQRLRDANGDAHSIQAASLLLEQANENLAEKRAELADAVRPVMGGAA